MPTGAERGTVADQPLVDDHRPVRVTADRVMVPRS